MLFKLLRYEHHVKKMSEWKKRIESHLEDEWCSTTG